jgi:hypothetical protein
MTNRVLSVVAVVVITLVAGCSGGDSDEPFTVAEVRKAFASVGVDLRAERLNRLDRDPCTSPVSVTGIDPATVGCASVVIPVEGGTPVDPKVLASIVTLWSESGRQRWAIFLYSSEDDARRAGDNPGGVGVFVAGAKSSRVRNAVLLYMNPEDERRFRNALM